MIDIIRPLLKHIRYTTVMGHSLVGGNFLMPNIHYKVTYGRGGIHIGTYTNDKGECITENEFISRLQYYARKCISDIIKNHLRSEATICQYEVLDSIGNHVFLSTEVGDLKVHKDVGSHFWFSTSHGSVDIGNNLGQGSRININGLGAIRIGGHISEDVTLKTETGDIIIRGTVDQNCTIDTKGSVFFDRRPKQYPLFTTQPKAVFINGKDCTEEWFPAIPLNPNQAFSAQLSAQGTSSRSTGTDAPASSSESMSLALQEYLDSFSPDQEAFSKAFARLRLDCPENLVCPVTLQVPNCPVRIEGFLFDYESLRALKTGEDGKKHNPLTQRPFDLRDIQPARDVRQTITMIISESELKNRPIPSAPPMPSAPSMEREKQEPGSQVTKMSHFKKNPTQQQNQRGNQDESKVSVSCSDQARTCVIL